MRVLRRGAFAPSGPLDCRAVTPAESLRRDAAGSPIVDGNGRTTVEAIWAAGNAVDPRLQVISSAGAGSVAAIAINADLVQEDVARAVEGIAAK